MVSEAHRCQALAQPASRASGQKPLRADGSALAKAAVSEGQVVADPGPWGAFRVCLGDVRKGHWVVKRGCFHIGGLGHWAAGVVPGTGVGGGYHAGSTGGAPQHPITESQTLPHPRAQRLRLYQIKGARSDASGGVCSVVSGSALCVRGGFWVPPSSEAREH